MYENQKALDILEFAIRAEIKAFAFYNFIANKIEEKELRFLCKNLAQDEKLHRLMLEDRYTFLAEGKKCKVDEEYKFEKDPAISSFGREELLKLAIDMERTAQQYYFNKSKEISDKKGKEILLELYNVETEHERKLTALLNSNSE
ncbi:ferritin family protein [bacterium]|nr:ferritin family protein [bacterium]